MLCKYYCYNKAYKLSQNFVHATVYVMYSLSDSHFI